MVARMTNTRRVATTLAVALSGSTSPTTLTPATYTGFPAAGQGTLAVGNPNIPASVEIVTVTDWATHPWPITRASDGSTAVSHAIGDGVATVTSETSLGGLVGVYADATLVANTTELEFDATTFDVGTSGGKATIGLTPSATPIVGNDSIWDAKGDLAAGTGSDAAVRVAVGTNGQLLSADSTQAAGLKWIDAAAGAAFAAPSGSLDLGDSNTEGVAATTVRSDHTHSFPAPGAGYPVDVAAAEADGTATTPARSDHVHAHGTGYLPDAHHARSHDHSNASDGTALAPASLDVTAGPVKLSGDISPAQLTGNQNDWNPTGLATAAVIRASTDAARTVTGLAGGADGRVLVLCNVGSQNLVLADESASSLAANRFALDQSLTLTGDTAATLLYDATSSRWRVIGVGKALGASSSAVASDSIWVAKGDLAAGTGTATAARMSAGTNGQVLQADSSQSTGLKWATVTTGSLTIEEVDGAPTGTFGKLKLPNGTLTDNGDGSATYTPAVGGTPAFVGAHVYRTTSLTVADNTDTAIGMDAEQYDTDGFHDNATNNTRLTVPSGKAGYYALGGAVQYPDDPDAQYATIRLRLNGTTDLPAIVGPGGAGSKGVNNLTTSTHYHLAVGDYVELVAYQWQSPAGTRVLAAGLSALWCALLGT